jgi:hypothetical protein
VATTLRLVEVPLALEFLLADAVRFIPMDFCPSNPPIFGGGSARCLSSSSTQRLEALQAAVARLEDGKVFDAVNDATVKVSRVFQFPAEQSLADGSDLSKKSSEVIESVQREREFDGHPRCDRLAEQHARTEPPLLHRDHRFAIESGSSERVMRMRFASIVPSASTTTSMMTTPWVAAIGAGTWIWRRTGPRE